MAEKRTLSDPFDLAKSMLGGKGSFPFAFDPQSVEGCTRGMAAFAEEMTRFVQARWQAEVEAWTKLSTCRDPSDAIALQQQHAQKTFADYAEEFTKLSRLMMEASTESLAAFQTKPAPVTKPVKIA
jgi:hypothetical protein